MDWHALHKKKVAELREMAHEKGHEGTSGLNKDQLVDWLAGELGIEKPHLVVDDADSKAKIKAQIRELKTVRQQALEARNREELKRARRQIHRLKRTVRKMGHLSR